jgi:integrase
VLLGLNGLRVSEACATNIEDLGVERGHRTLRVVGKGNKPATVPLVPRTARTIDLAVGERHDGPILRRRDGQRLDRRTDRWVGKCRRSCRRTASDNPARRRALMKRWVVVSGRHGREPSTSNEKTNASDASLVRLWDALASRSI